MDPDRANPLASTTFADKTAESVHQPATISSTHDRETDNPNDLESRLRSLILSNGIPQKDSNPASNPATATATATATSTPTVTTTPMPMLTPTPTPMESSDPPRVFLPPHMRLAPPAMQQEWLAKAEQLKNVSSVPASSARTQAPVQAPVQAPRKKPNQAQRRQLKTQFAVQPSHGPIANIASGMSGHTISARGAVSQPTNPTQQQVRLTPQQAQPLQLQAHPTQQQAHLSQHKGRAPQQQDRPAPQQTMPPQLQGPPSQQQGRLSHQQGPVPQQPPASTSSVSNRPFPITMHNPNASSTFPLIPGHQPSRSGNPYNPQHGPIQHGQFARPPPQNRQLYQPRGNGHLGHPQQQHTPNYNPLSPDDVKAQVDYLNETAEVEIAEAEMDVEDLQEKENLRLLLQRICRSAIGSYERQNGAIFDESGVSLQCFGSLRSGFATRGSDMDLALVSPSSKPDTASPDSVIPRLLEKALLDQGYGARLLTRTRVPIIKFCEKPTPELADALRKARAGWEEEMDAPPKPDMAKLKEARKAESQMKGKETSEPADLKDGCEATDREVAEQLPESEIPRTLSVTEQSAGEVTVDVGRVPEIGAEAKGKGKERANEHQNSRIVPTADAQKGEEEGQGSGEEDLPYRSDDELVRLYQLAISEGWFGEEERKLVSGFASAVERHGSDGDHSELVAARLQLETLSHVLKRYREPPDTHLDFPKGGIGIQCDINFSNHLALHNTLLLRCYSHCDPRVRLAVLFVKAWAKRRKINSPYHGTLSSYGYVLMVLHYLVNIAQPPLVPNLQLAWRPPRHGSRTTALNETTVDGYDVRFWRSEGEIQDLSRRGMLTHNRETVGSLLRGFFQYFAVNGAYVPHGGFSWTQYVLSLRTRGGILTKQEKGWTGAKTTITEPTAAGQQGREVRHRYLFAIEDPFEIDHNIARTVVHDGIVAIRDEFRRAHRIIQNAGRRDMGPMEDLFAEGQEKEPRPRRAFGPLPPPPTAPKKEAVGNAGSAQEQNTRKDEGGLPGGLQAEAKVTTDGSDRAEA